MSLRPKEWHASHGGGAPAVRGFARTGKWLAMVALGLGVPATLGPAVFADPPAQPADQPVDPATKQLIAANGLFTRGLFKLAADEYQDFLKQYPQDPNALQARYALGMCDFRLNSFDQTIADLQPVLADDKFASRDQALAVVGYSQLSLKQYDKAMGSFDELLAKYPRSKLAESAGLNRVQASYLANQPQKAIDAANAFEKQFPQTPQQPASLYFKALAQRSLQQNDQTVATLAELIKNFPNSAYQTDALLLSGQAHESLGQVDGAIADYTQMLASASAVRKGEAGYALGMAQYRAKKYPEAAASLAPVADETPPGQYAKSARLELGWSLLAAGKMPDARNAFNAVIANDPDHANEARYALAQCDIADKQYDPAEKTLAALALLQPPPANLPQVLLDRAVCLMELQKFDEAQQPLAAVPAAHPTPGQTAEAAYRQAFCLNKLGKFDQSHVMCQQISALPPGDFARPAHELDAENLFQLGKYDDAENAFAALKTDAPPAAQPRIVLRIGQSEYFAGHFDKSAATLAPLAADPQTGADPTLRPAMFIYGDALLQLGKNADASAALSKYLAVAGNDPDVPEAQFKLALSQLHNNQPDAAHDSFTRLVAGPDNSPYVQRGLLELGQMDYKAAKLDPASASLNRLLNAHPAPELAEPALYLLAWTDFDSKRYPDAAAKWQQVAATYPNTKLAEDASYQEGVALFQAKENDKALPALQAFAAAQPDSPNTPHAQQLAAQCLTALGRNADAAKLLAAVAAGPKPSDTVLYDLAWAQRSSKDDGGAIASYQRLVAEHPDSKLVNPARSEQAELLYDQKNYPQAATLLEAVLADKSADATLMPPAHYRLGWCYQKLGQNEKAAAQFETFSDVPPGNDDLAVSALFQAGVAESAGMHADRAETDFALLLKKYPQNPQASVAILKLGEAQNEQQKWDAAAATFGTFLSQYPKDPLAYAAHFGVGWASENRKQFDAARDAYKSVTSTDNGPTAAHAQFQIGETYLSEQKFDQAIPALLAVEDVYSYPQWSARALFEAGRAFEQIKQPDQARKQYSTVVSKYKDAPEASMAQDRLNALKS